MYFSYFIALVVCVFLAGQVLAAPLIARDENFCIYFYKKPNYKTQAGFICGSLKGKGDHAARPNANMPVVGSLKAPDWLQVTLFDGKGYSGKSRVFQGNKQNITPSFNIQSFKFLH
ncbi:hypothetical protein BC941DRAFT_446239, partial [Chlamydoabsidia padenii]